LWVTVSGLVGAHVFEVLAYQQHELARRPLLLLELWNGLSSFGGFLGGAIGFTLVVRSRRLPIRLMADITMVGLLPAFTISRIACALVAVDPGSSLLAWKLRWLELVCLLPINAVVLTLARRRQDARRAGLIAAMATVMYAPVRLSLDFLRPEEIVPRYVLLTFAQWGALLVGLFSLSLLIDILVDGRRRAES
jgi:phosphatidylglycerol:prolipoprotein diacylglycerol transferase